MPSRIASAVLLRLLLVVLAAGLPSGAFDARAAIETTAPRVLLVEADSGTTLYAKAADEAFAPANFTKLVTAAVVFDAIARGEIAEGDAFLVSEHAWRTGGAPARVTTMFAKVNSRVPVGDLLRGLTVHYANDAAIALAEGLAGSEAAFAERMNALAAEIGMTGSLFVNPTGYADADARTTLDDLARLVDYLRERHAGFYALYALGEFEWNGILQTNKTSLVRELAGVEGLMLAYDEAAGFGGAISAVRDGRRVLVLASGFRSENDRDRQVRALLDAAFSEFVEVTLFPPGAEVSTVRVFGGRDARVAVTGAGAVRVTLPRDGRDDFRARVVYQGPVPAPIDRGQEVAALEIRIDDRVVQSVPLVAAEPVPVGDLPARARDGLMELLFGWW